MKILIVDDEVGIAKQIAGLMMNRGHEVLTAATGEEGIEVFTANKDIELVITDLTMPGVTGIELTRTIKQISPSVRVCMFSGYYYGNTEEEAREAGAEKTWRKPKSIIEMFEELKL